MYYWIYLANVLFTNFASSLWGLSVCSCLVVSLVFVLGKCQSLGVNWEVNVSSSVFWKNFSWLDSIFSLNILWNSSVKPPRTGVFFVENSFMKISVYLSDKELTRLFVLEWSLVVCVFFGICPLSFTLWIYWHKIVPNSPLVFFSVCGVYVIVASLISDIVRLWLSFFLISLARRLSLLNDLLKQSFLLCFSLQSSLVSFINFFHSCLCYLIFSALDSTCWYISSIVESEVTNLRPKFSSLISFFPSIDGLLRLSAPPKSSLPTL